MEISNKIPPVATKLVTPTSKQKNEKVAQPAATGERVVLSDRAKELQAAFQAVKQMGDVDQDKVDRIKAQLKGGTYKVDAEKAADKMIEESLMGSK